tara:strand:- start:7214 stop:7804 length:591 start_codon:yes stop_codon:yes gene_type:complete
MNKEQLRREILEQEENIQDQERLLKIWEKLPRDNKNKIHLARLKVRRSEGIIQDRNEKIESLGQTSTGNPSNQVSLFDEIAEISRRSADLAKKAESLSKIPDRAHNMMDTPEKGIQEKKKKNKSQNAQILDVFKAFPEALMTPWDVNRFLAWPEKRITSTRRGITDLKRDGILVKGTETRVEQEGTVNALYKLAKI